MATVAGPVLTVRHAVAQDRPRVLAIAAAAMRAYGIEPEFDGLDRELGRFGSEPPGPVVYLVAEWQGAVIGSLLLAPKDDGVLKLNGFYVDAACRGCGAGRALLQRAVDVATERGARAIYLETWDAMTAAGSLYHAFGWLRSHRLAPDSGAEWAWLLELPQSLR
jgi:GNAT superfamily N-acetyltransferase